MRHIDTIIIHAAATPPDWRSGTTAEHKRDEIRRWHLDRGWRDIGVPSRMITSALGDLRCSWQDRF